MIVVGNMFLALGVALIFTQEPFSPTFWAGVFFGVMGIIFMSVWEEQDKRKKTIMEKNIHNMFINQTLITLRTLGADPEEFDNLSENLEKAVDNDKKGA